MIQKFILGDCMNPENGMPSFPDKYFDLAIVDPPYGLPDRSKQGAGKLINRKIQGMYDKGWDIKPDKEYFNELFRVSKNQIICGGNYYTLPPSRGFIIWDKKQPWENFSRCEYLWNSIDGVSKIFEFDNRTGDKIHPTQKPIALYKWLIKNYAKEGYKILDTHAGSCSSLIAYEEMGLDYVAFEIDEEYYKKACERINNYRQQLKLFPNTFET
jgi:site-specific DNA-methyltransferase (adenine-specific)